MIRDLCRQVQDAVRSADDSEFIGAIVIAAGVLFLAVLASRGCR